LGFTPAFAAAAQSTNDDGRVSAPTLGREKTAAVRSRGVDVQGRYSADGRWWWDGARWVPVATGAPGGIETVREVAFAGFWIRFAAWFIDWLLSRAAALVIGFIFGFAGAFLDSMQGSNAISNAGSILTQILVVAAGWIYFAVMHSSRLQASLGQMALGISVTDYEGRRISFLRATGRYFASLLSYLICFIGYLMIAFTDRKQGLHDLIAGTVMVRSRAVPGIALRGSRMATAPATGAGVAVSIAVGIGAILLFMSVVVIVVLLTMGHQIQNVYSNVVVALNSP
jgi:uncharacterized RDD family membrane protein YckC